MDPFTVLINSGRFLTDYERMEIGNYSEVYYFGSKAVDRKIEGNFDDPEGYYRIVLNDHIGYRYEVLESIGIGGCGQVVKAYDHKEKKMVALKIIRNIPVYQDLAEQEVRISELLAKKDASNTLGVVHILHHFLFRDHQIMIFELLGLNLFQVLKSNKFRGFKESVVRDFAVEILQCLDQLFLNKIVHCDIKPENIMTHSRTSPIRSFSASATTTGIIYETPYDGDYPSGSASEAKSLNFDQGELATDRDQRGLRFLLQQLNITENLPEQIEKYSEASKK